MQSTEMQDIVYKSNEKERHMMERIIGVIPARYQSSRFPGKPLADICGKPMIWWVYQQCMKVKELDALYVATDDGRIENVCRTLGMNVIMTDSSHKTGTDRVGEVARKIEGDLFVNIQGDEPLIDPREIEEVIHIFDDRSVYFASLRVEITDPEEIQAASTVKVVVDSNSNALYLSRSPIPSNAKGRKPASVYRHVGIYAYKRDFLLKFTKMPQTELEIGEGIEPLRALEHGYKFRVKETKFTSIGVDYPEHIQRVEREMRRRKETVLDFLGGGDLSAPD